MGTPKTIIVAALPKTVGTNRTLAMRLPQQQNCVNMTSILTPQPKSASGAVLNGAKPPASVEPEPLDSKNKEIVTEMNVEPARKRQRLDHLSIEQKILRRKLKNRVAAQSARDRKKQRLEELEAMVDEMENKNDALYAQNQFLKLKNTQLEIENEKLKQRLLQQPPALSSPTIKSEPVETGLSLKTEEVTTQEEGFQNQSHHHVDSATAVSPEILARVNCTSFEPAELINGPLQKGQERQLAQALMLNCLCWAWISTVMTVCTFSSKCLKTCSVKETWQSFQERQSRLPAKKRIPLAQWWGPHQRCWNPADPANK